MRSETPLVTTMQVIPVAGHDGMLLNLCGAHAPYFTRNIVSDEPWCAMRLAQSYRDQLVGDGGGIASSSRARA